MKPKVYFDADVGGGAGAGRPAPISQESADRGTSPHANTDSDSPVHLPEESTRENSTRTVRSGLSHRTAARHLEATTLYRPTTLLYMAAIFFLLVPVLTLVDIPLARYFASDPFPSELRSTMELTLVFSHGTGVFLILLALLLMAPRRRWHVPRLAGLALGGGALATMAKMFVLRPRPQGLDLEHAGFETAWLWVFDWDLSQVTMFDASTRAFPSGNVVTATALTIGLWVTLPRGRPLFALVWCGVLLQRLQSGSHFPSDVCGGVAFGLLWAYVCFHPKLLGTLFDKLVPEKRRSSRQMVERPEVALPAGTTASASRRHRPAVDDEGDVESSEAGQSAAERAA